MQIENFLIINSNTVDNRLVQLMMKLLFNNSLIHIIDNDNEIQNSEILGLSINKLYIVDVLIDNVYLQQIIEINPLIEIVIFNSQELNNVTLIGNIVQRTITTKTFSLYIFDYFVKNTEATSLPNFILLYQNLDIMIKNFDMYYNYYDALFVTTNSKQREKYINILINYINICNIVSTNINIEDYKSILIKSSYNNSLINNIYYDLLVNSIIKNISNNKILIEHEDNFIYCYNEKVDKQKLIDVIISDINNNIFLDYDVPKKYKMYYDIIIVNNEHQVYCKILPYNKLLSPNILTDIKLIEYIGIDEIQNINLLIFERFNVSETKHETDGGISFKITFDKLFNQNL